MLGEKDAAFTALEQASVAGNHVDTIKTDVELDNLRSDPREETGGVQLDDLANALQAAVKELEESLAPCNVVSQRSLLPVQAGCASRQDLDDWIKVSGVAAEKMNAAAKVWTQMQATQPTEAQQYNELEKTFARVKKNHEKITSLIVRRLSTKPDLADVISSIEDLQNNIEDLQNEVASLAPGRRRSS